MRDYRGGAQSVSSLGATPREGDSSRMGSKVCRNNFLDNYLAICPFSQYLQIDQRKDPFCHEDVLRGEILGSKVSRNKNASPWAQKYYGPRGGTGLRVSRRSEPPPGEQACLGMKIVSDTCRNDRHKVSHEHFPPAGSVNEHAKRRARAVGFLSTSGEKRQARRRSKKKVKAETRRRREVREEAAEEE